MVHGDTDKVQFGMGTYGSRSGAVGMSAIVKALDKIEAKAKKVAAHLLEAAEADIEFKDGQFTVAGTDKSAAWGDVALNAYIAHKFSGAGARARPEGRRVLRPDQLHLPGRLPYLRSRDRSGYRRHRDRRTGPRSTISACVINPMIVEGQVHGGIAQGVGQALLEGAVYDETASSSPARFMDYCHAPRRPPAGADGRRRR